MPLPSPKGKEQRSKFISRCMGSAQTKKDFPDIKQRVAVCNSRWRKAKKSKAAQVELSLGELEALDILIAAKKKKKKKKKNNKVYT